MPPRLYRYEAITLQSRSNLRNHQVYFGPPSNFNDRYDCGFQPIITRAGRKYLAELNTHYQGKENIPAATKEEIGRMGPEQWSENLDRATKGAVQDLMSSVRSKRGIVCFSEKNDNLLMWGHYGGKYRGMCLEFDTKLDPFSGAKKVLYKNNLPEISAKRILIDKDYSDILRLFYIKSKSWEYESEWRCIHREAGTAYGYSPEALTGIYFGPDSCRSDIDALRGDLSHFKHRIRFFQGRLSATQFKVEFTEV